MSAAKKTQRRLRIAMLGHKRMPSREGGAEVVVGELAVRMAAQGHEVTCYNRSGHHVSGKGFTAAKAKEYRGVRLMTVPALPVKGLAAMTASLAATLRAAFGRYDVVHFHTEGACAALWLPKLLGKRCVVTVHGLDHQRCKWGRMGRMYILLGEKIAARWADEIIVLSRGVQAYFGEKYRRETVLIPNGRPVMLRREAKEIRRQYGLGKDDYILYLGRITPEKGIACLLEAFKDLGTDKKLVIAGGASDSATHFAALREMAQADDRIVFTGFVQGDVLEELYSNALVYVLPSELEGMPISLLEAIQCGCCCLVSDIPENRDVVHGCGMTFRRGDAADLREKLAMLLAEPERLQECRRKAYEQSKHAVTWDEVAARTLALYYQDKTETDGGDGA